MDQALNEPDPFITKAVRSNNPARYPASFWGALSNQGALCISTVYKITESFTTRKADSSRESHEAPQPSFP